LARPAARGVVATSSRAPAVDLELESLAARPRAVDASARPPRPPRDADERPRASRASPRRPRPPRALEGVARRTAEKSNGVAPARSVGADALADDDGDDGDAVDGVDAVASSRDGVVVVIARASDTVG
jgi:hypothetical protein